MTRRGAWIPAILLLTGVSCRTSAPSPSSLPPYLLDPRLGFPGPFHESVGRAWAQLRGRDAPGAMRLFEKAADDPAARIGLIQCQLMLGRFQPARDGCQAALDQGLDTAPLLAACGEAEARAGNWTEAFNLFEGAALRLPENGEILRLEEEAAPRAAGAWLEKGRTAREAGEMSEARISAERALAIDSQNGEAMRLAGEAALAEEDFEDAFVRLSTAWKQNPADAGLGEEVGDAALRTERYETASRVFGELALSDSRFRERAREAEEEFLISNWPVPDRAAAHAARLTRAQAALLAWRLVPRIREAPAAGPAPVASDIVARKDRRVLSRCLQLGLLAVEEATHRARPDAALRRSEALRLLKRVSALKTRGGDLPENLLPGGKGAGVSGQELRRGLRALDSGEGE